LAFGDPDEGPEENGNDSGKRETGGLVTVYLFAAGILLLIVLLYFAY